MKDTRNPESIITRIENYLTDYCTLAESYYRLPLALWAAATHCWPSFDSFPYLVITAMTKQSGKTRLMELLSNLAANASVAANQTASTLFRSITEEKPTIFFDEAESLSREDASDIRACLNVGYRRGQTIPRTVGNRVVQFETYCPKTFVLIGDVYDTLRDRSIIVTMKRAEPKMRYLFSAAKARGEELREVLHTEVEEKRPDIEETYYNFAGLPFLADRDEEIWTPLFVLCSILCPERKDELTRAAADMSTEKTAEARQYRQLLSAEENATQDMYNRRLLADMLTVTHGKKSITTQAALDALRDMATAPWRKFRGEGLQATNLADMLQVFGVRPCNIRMNAVKNGKGQKIAKGYKAEQIAKAAKVAGINHPSVAV